jgi:hypothetical protein
MMDDSHDDWATLDEGLRRFGKAQSCKDSPPATLEGWEVNSSI